MIKKTKKTKLQSKRYNSRSNLITMQTLMMVQLVFLMAMDLKTSSQQLFLQTSKLLRLALDRSFHLIRLLKMIIIIKRTMIQMKERPLLLMMTNKITVISELTLKKTELLMCRQVITLLPTRVYVNLRQRNLPQLESFHQPKNWPRLIVRNLSREILNKLISNPNCLLSSLLGKPLKTAHRSPQLPIRLQRRLKS